MIEGEKITELTIGVVTLDLVAPGDNQMPQDVAADTHKGGSFEEASGKIGSDQTAAIDELQVHTMRHAHHGTQVVAWQDLVMGEMGVYSQSPLDVIVEEQVGVFEHRQERRPTPVAENAGCGRSKELS
jgi:hypothetical protein